MRKSKLYKKTSSKKRPTQKKKYPLRGLPVIYRDPFDAVNLGNTEESSRIPGIDKGKVTILPNFDEPLPEFDL